jgi:hypothetical protein
MHLLDFKTMAIDTTIYDDTIFSAPVTQRRIYHRYIGQKADPQEWLCSNNRDFYDQEKGDLEHDVKDKAINGD